MSSDGPAAIGPAPLRRAARWVGAALAPLLGAWVGATHATAFATPEALDPKQWTLVTPGLDTHSLSVDQGRGVYLAEGALLWVPPPFRRPTLVSPAATTAVGRLDVTLDPTSGPLKVVFRDSAEGGLPVLVRLEARSFPVPGGAVAGPSYTLTLTDGTLAILQGQAPVALGHLGPSRVELSSDTDPVRLRALSIADTSGAPIVAVDPPDDHLLRAGVGAGVGLGVGIVGVFAPWTLPWALLPVLVALPGLPWWISLGERLYLTHIAGWTLARLVAGASALPWLGAALLATGLFVPARARRFQPVGWALVLGAVAGAATMRGGATWAAVPGGLLLLSQPLLAWRAHLDARGMILRELPGLLAVAWLGWDAGLLPLVAWRTLTTLGAAGVLARHNASAGVQQLLLTGLLWLPAVEAAARATSLETEWDAERIAGEGATDDGWKSGKAFWKGACGEGADERVVVFAGGSSTGGAFQNGGRPDLFFPSDVHNALCGQLPPGTRLETRNFGQSGRDTFTISRTIEAMLGEAKRPVVVLYVGVNDLLTHSAPLTRKQREERAGAPVEQASWIAARSRVITGLGLLVQPPVQVAVDDASLVEEVPLPDAEENLERIAAAVDARGGRTLLLTEFVIGHVVPMIAPYAALEQRLADASPTVDTLDVQAALTPYVDEGLLIDQNHLTAQGHARLAEVLAPKVRELLTAP